MIATRRNNDIVISNISNFDLDKTFECGQCFRWNKQLDGEYIGVFRNRILKLYKEDNNIVLKNTTKNEYLTIWKPYFDMDRNYKFIDDNLTGLLFIENACAYSSGIRILKQDPWETLISFIISQNNNIPRIKLIIERLCKKFGHRLEIKGIIEGSDRTYYSFPTIEDMKNASINDIADLKCGFRDRYILDAITKVRENNFILDDIYSMELAGARGKLMEIKGVGKKVADCTLLYGFGRMECFPVDVWIKKVLDRYFTNGLPNINPDFMGIVQQYIFYYVRSNSDILKGSSSG